MSDLSIDLNADLGERPEAYDSDIELMKFITSANIACGGHAGDVESVARMIEAACPLSVAVGAHPSFPDRKDFGRIAMAIDLPELEKSLREQLELISNAAAQFGTRLTHVKPHGALYHSASSEPAIAQAIANAVRAIDPSLCVVAQYASIAADRYRNAGLRTATEAFVDRTYEPDGTLRSRFLPGALLDLDRAIAQALNIVLHHRVMTTGGTDLLIRADTLCIHSDTPGAPEIARKVRASLQAAGVRIKPLY